MNSYQSHYKSLVPPAFKGIMIKIVSEPLQIFIYTPGFGHVIFHKRVRVFYQGFQTRENNGIHEAVYQAIFIVLENL